MQPPDSNRVSRAALALWTGLLLVLGWRAEFLDGHHGGNIALAMLFGACALAGMIVSARLRSGPRALDGAHALVWLHPLQPQVWRSLGLLGCVAVCCLASLAVLALDPGLGALGHAARTRWQRWGWRKTLVYAIGAAFALATWLINLATPESKGFPELDPSWQASVMRSVEQGRRAGVDWIFTYGPLGLFDVGVYSSKLYWVQRLAYDVWFKLPVALAFGVWFARASGWAQRLLILGTLWLFASGPDDQAVLSITLLAALWMTTPFRTRRRRWIWLGLVMTLILLFGLVKFTYFALGVCACLCMLLRLVSQPDANGRTDQRWSDLLRGAALMAITLAGVWLLAGQRLGDLFAWMHNSFEVASGYGKTMSTALTGSQLRWGVGTLALALTLRWLPVLRQRPSLSVLSLEALVAAAAFLAFKSAYTRHGGAPSYLHVIACVGLLPRMLQPSRSDAKQASSPLVFAGQALAMLAALATDPQLRATPRVELIMQARANFNTILHCANYVRKPNQWRERVEREQKDQSEVLRNSVARQLIGSRSMDVLTNMQAIGVYGDFQWQPRPVIQSYTAYTPRLIELNRSYFAGERAPQCVLLQPDDLDNRFPLQEDGAALLEIFRRYRPIGFDLGHLVMERSPEPTVPVSARPILHQGELAFGEVLDLTNFDSASLVLELDVELNYLGELLTIALGGPWAHLRLTYTDGEIKDRRIVPPAAKAGLLVRPLLEDAWGMVRFFSGMETRQLQSIAVTVPHGWTKYFKPKVGVRVLDASDLVWTRDRKLWNQALAPFVSATGGATCEIDLDGNPSVVFAHNQLFLHLHAPARVRFTVPPGEWNLFGSYSLDPSVATACPNADGIFFRVQLDTNGQREILLEDHVRFDIPETKSAQLDSLPRLLNLSFETSVDAELVFELDSAGDLACDWGLLRGLLLVPRPAPR